MTSDAPCARLRRGRVLLYEEQAKPRESPKREGPHDDEPQSGEQLEARGRQAVGRGVDGRRRAWPRRATLERIAPISWRRQTGVEIAVVVGGGNFFRGIAGADKGIERAGPTSIGMLATVMNGSHWNMRSKSRVTPRALLSAVPMPSLCEAYSRRRPAPPGQGPDRRSRRRHRQSVFHDRHGRGVARGRIVSPTSVLKATQVDGVYTADPKRDPTAVRYDG